MPNDIDYALLSTRVYDASKLNKTGVPAGWTELPWQKDYRFSGFSAGAYRRGNEVVIAYTGTNQNLDWLSSVPAVFGLLPAPQVFDAMRFYLDVKAANPDATSFTFSGHSLGGGLASLMAVFFNKQATVFDEAPFQLSAFSPIVPVLLTSLQASLLLNGYTDLDFALYNASFGALFPLREGNVNHIYLEGEALAAYRSGFTTIAGSETSVPMGSSTLGARDRHDMTLLTAMLGNPGFASMVQQLPNLATFLLDPAWFGVKDRRTPGKTDLLSSLLRNQYGAEGVPADGRLDRFAADMQQLLGTAGVAQTNAAVRDALMAASMEYFYTKAGTTADKLFTTEGNGIHFKYSDIGAASYLSLPLLANAVESLLGSTAPGAYTRPTTQDAWHIQSGAAGMSWTATGADNDAAIGGTGDDTLDGGAGNDFLYGGDGADSLSGGAGDDQMYGGRGNDQLQGGNGYDRYVIDGSDTIQDTDGQGTLRDKAGIAISGGILKLENGSYVYLSDPGITVAKSADLTLGLADGSSVTIKSYQDGNLGLHLYEETAAAETTRTILGDLAVGTAQDDLGNLVPIGGNAPGRDDTLQDSAGNDLIRGLGGNDFIYSWRGGDDKIEGGDGDDWMVGGMGKDVVQGGAGRDVLVEGGGDDKLYAGEIVTVSNALAVENAAPSGLQGEALSGSAGDDLAIGGAGNDVLLGGTGDDILIAGAGDDDIDGDAMAANIRPNWRVIRNVSTSNGVTSYNPVYDQFNMEWPSAGGNDAIFAGAGADWVSAGYGNDYVDGGNDDDVLWGEGGNDDLFGGSGNDVINGDNANLATSDHGDDYLDGEDGDDTLFGEGGNDQLFGGTGNDQLYADDGAAGAGNDTLDGEDGNDVLLGGAKDDELYGGAGNDFLQGDSGTGIEDGDDYLDGGTGDDILLGEGGMDELHGGDGNDQIAGDNGGGDSSGAADTIFGGAGNDLIDGQGGDDAIDGGADNDQLQGGDGNDTLDGGEGSDVLFGEAGNDTLHGGAGADYLLGGLGDDLLDGGGGDDVYYYSMGEGNDRIVDAGGSDWLVFNDISWGQVQLGVGSLKLSVPGGEIHLDDFDPDNPYAAGGIEYFQFAGGVVMTKNQLIDALGFTPTGTPEADVLTGTALSDTIRALAGDDLVTARAGNDSIYADDGADTVYAGEGNDQIFGGAGDDVLLGEGGNDTLYGETGNDLLAGGAGSDQLLGGEGDDSYLFQAGDGQDTVTDALGRNGIALGAGLTLDAIGFSRQGDDLHVAVKNTTDRLTIKDWFAADSHFATLTLGDGTVLDHAGVEAALPRNQAPVATADTASVSEDGILVVSGNALANDSDPEGRALRVTNPGNYAGAVGTLALGSNGAFSYSLANDTTAVQSLAAGQSLVEGFAYTVSDDDPNGAATAASSINITVQGANDLPVLGADSAATVEDTAVPVTGNLLANDRDVDAGTTLTIANPGTRAGTYGTLTVAADGAYSYSLANASNAVQALAAGQSVTENFAQTVSDGIAQVGGNLTISLSGRNDAPIVASALADQSVAVNTNWTWQLPAGSFTDVDAGDVLGYGATLADGTILPAWLSFSAATQTFSGRVPKSATGSIDIRVSATDRAGASAADTFNLAFGGGGGGGNGGGNGGGSQGNEGVGNGQDAPPPGHDASFNDGPGTGPGNPGAQGGNGYRPKQRTDLPLAQVHIAGPLHEAHSAPMTHGASGSPPGQTKKATAARQVTAAPANETTGAAQPVAQASMLSDSGAPADDLAAWLDVLTAQPGDPQATRKTDAAAVARAWGQVDTALLTHLATAPDDALGAHQAGHPAQSQYLLATLDDPLAQLAANASLRQFKGLKEGFGKIA